MNDVLGSELAEPEVKGDAFPQDERPLFEVGAGVPLLGEARGILAALGVHLEQGFQERVVLEMVGAGDHPVTVGLREPSGGKHQSVGLGRLGQSWCWRGNQGQCQRHQQSQHK